MTRPKEKKSVQSATGKQQAPKAEPERPDYHQLLRQLIARANGGDREALKRLRAFLDKNPWLWRRAGDLAAAVEGAWVTLLAGADQLARESLLRKVATLKAELAGERPTALEKILVEQVASCYLATRYAEIEASCPPGGSLQQAAFRLKRAESAQRRLLGAAKTLTALRALVPNGLAPAPALKAVAEKKVG